jgi:hypothetical protein
MPNDNTLLNPEEPKEFFELSRGAQELRPRMLIAIYKLNGASESAYIEQAHVDSKGRVLSFMPMSTKQLTAFANNILSGNGLKPESAIGGWTGERILYVDVSGRRISIIWKRDPGTAEVRYSKGLGISDGVIATPGMILSCTSSGTLSVWAYREYAGKDTDLCHLPFHNVYETGRVCMGQSSTKFLAKDTLHTYCDRWEWLFFNTAGNEIHYDKGFPDNINTLHKKLRQGEPFPTDKLVEFRRKVNKIL